MEELNIFEKKGSFISVEEVAMCWTAKKIKKVQYNKILEMIRRKYRNFICNKKLYKHLIEIECIGDHSYNPVCRQNWINFIKSNYIDWNYWEEKEKMNPLISIDNNRKKYN